MDDRIEYLKSSLERAIGGRELGRLKALTSGFMPLGGIRIQAYYQDRPTRDDELELEEIASEVAADFADLSDICVTVVDSRNNALSMLDFWITDLHD